jgi:hypothetical protein
MKLCRFALISIVSVIILMMGCSSSDNKPAESSNPPAVAAQPEVKQPVLYTGVEAFNPMIGLAMKWAPDAQPACLEAVLTPEATGQNGKATIWRGYFASPSRRAVKTIVCSGSRRPDAPPFGTSTEGNDGPHNADAANLAFLPLLAKTDTDKAFEIARSNTGGTATSRKTRNNRSHTFYSKTASRTYPSGMSSTAPASMIAKASV